MDVFSDKTILDETYEEDEIFFGPVSTKEEMIKEKFKNRKTEYYSPSRFQAVETDDKILHEEKMDLIPNSDKGKYSDVVSYSCHVDDMTNVNDNVKLITDVGEHEEGVFSNTNNRNDSSIDISCDHLNKCDSVDQISYLNICRVNDNSNDSNTVGNENLTENKESCEELTIGISGRNLNSNNSLGQKTLNDIWHISECKDEQRNKNLTENSGNCEKFTNEIVCKNQCGSKCISIDEGDISDNEKVAHLPFDLGSSLGLKKKFSTSEPNDLNKPDTCTLKRESYFSSLQIINVHDETFDDFTLDSLECNNAVDTCSSVIREDIYGKRTNAKLSEKFLVDSLEECGSDLENLDSLSVTNLETHSLSEDSVDKQYPNNAILYSRTPSLNSKNETSNEILDNSSLQDTCKIYNEISEMSLQNYSDSPPSFPPPSPDQKLNDTIEEMEQLLARGINYYKDLDIQKKTAYKPKERRVSSSGSVLDNSSLQNMSKINNDISEELIQNYSDSPKSVSPPLSPDQKLNDTVEEMEKLLAHGINYYRDLDPQKESVHKSKERRISSSDSVHSFNPNFDSTHASTDLKRETNINNNDIPLPKVTEKEELCSKEVTNKEPVPGKLPRVIISKPTPKLPSNKFPSRGNIQKCKVITPLQMNIPVVETVTESIIGNSTPLPLLDKKDNNSTLNTQKKIINTTPYNTLKNCNITPYNTSRSKGIAATGSKSFSSRLVSTPSSTKFVSQNMISSSVFCSKAFTNRNVLAKESRLTPAKVPDKVFRTPQYTVSKIKKVVSKSAQPTTRHKTLDIVSPVAKYLQNNPPPPLITTVKPRYKLSPLRSCVGDAHHSLKDPLKESNSSKSEKMASKIPQSVHKQGEGFLVNKENLLTKRAVPGDRPPVFFLKHKGRMRIPKDAVPKDETDSPNEISNDNKEKSEKEKLSDRVSGASLMEVSIYEPHLVRHLNTLK